MTARWLWPTPAQTNLLRAALGDGETALAAFRAWRDQTDLDGPVDPGTQRLLPLLHANLKRLGADDPIMPRLMGVRRHAWSATQIKLRHCVKAAVILHAAGIPAMVSKGLVLAQCHYGSPGLRPMSDIDLIVARADFERAIDALQNAGWTPDPRATTSPHWRDYFLKYSHAITLKLACATELDLHADAGHDFRSSASSDWFWSRAQPFDLGHVTALRPDATSLFLQAAIHGLHANALPPLRWIADTTMILREEGKEIAWKEMVDFARTESLLARLAMALRYLHDVMDQPIPAAILEEANGHAPHLLERIEHPEFLQGGTFGITRGIRYRAAFLARLLKNDGPGGMSGYFINWAKRKVSPGQPAR